MDIPPHPPVRDSSTTLGVTTLLYHPTPKRPCLTTAFYSEASQRNADILSLMLGSTLFTTCNGVKLANKFVQPVSLWDADTSTLSPA